VTVTTDPFHRDHYGRPLIPPAEGGASIPYQRVSTFAGMLDDKGGLLAWQAWTVLRGARQLPEIATQAADTPTVPKRLIDQLVEAGGGKANATRGTDRHTLVAARIQGQPLPDMPLEARAELEQVADAIRSLGTLRGVEVPIVNDQWRVAGSCDYWLEDPDGRPVVADLKTGKQVYPATAVQLVAYARGQHWTDNHRGPWIASNKPRLIAVHAPQDGSGVRLLEVEPQQATAAAELALAVRDHRKTARTLFTPVKETA
jgi:hypothetical protein